ncbi:MAG TPA: DUF58 domain-containing protein [Gemmatimonadaceae bacterium]|nr:DUF58 domain-containing protein [Gemmatimonadaceae bacterium]
MSSTPLAPPHRADLVDPSIVAALGRIEVIARWVVDGFLTGLHRSPRKGFSVEFAEHRPYQAGDELRYVDWKIAARTDRWVVKQYEEETNLRVTIVLDVSRSMAWSGAATRLTKLAYAERLAAVLALLFLRQRDAVGLVRFDDRVRTAIPPRVRHGHWTRIVAALDDPGSGQASRAGDGLDQARRQISRRGWVVLISDLLMEGDDLLRATRALRAAGHQVTVFHIMDPAERDLDASGDAIFVDPESEIEVPAAVAEVRGAYRATVEAALREWRAALAAAGASYEVVDTAQPFAVPMRRALNARERQP